MFYYNQNFFQIIFTIDENEINNKIKIIFFISLKIFKNKRNYNFNMINLYKELIVFTKAFLDSEL